MAPSPSRLTLCREAPGLNGGLLPLVADWLKRQAAPRLVIVDTLGAAGFAAGGGGASESAYRREYRWPTN